MEKQPYSVRINAETARELATKGATIVLLDVPEGTAIGMDQQTFLVGPKFKGVKMVPPGVHVVSYSAADAHGSFGPTTAFFTSLRGGEVAAWSWNPQEEIMQRVDDEQQAAALEQAVKTFQLDAHLAPYNLAAYPQWQQLAWHVTAKMLGRVAPVGGNINILAEAGDLGEKRPATAAEAALEAQLQKNRDEKEAAGAGASNVGQQESSSAAHAGRCYFTPLPRLVKRQGLTPGELTSLNLDKSGVLEDILLSKFAGNESEFLGEFQFAFLAFLLGHSLEGFSQWKAFLSLMLGCKDAALGNRAPLFTRFLEVVHAQLLHSLAPGGALEQQAAPLGIPMVEELLEDSFLRRLTTGWLRWVMGPEGAAAPEPLRQAASGVASLLHTALGWECGAIGRVEELGGENDGGGVDDEDEDDGPVVVGDTESFY